MCHGELLLQQDIVPISVHTLRGWFPRSAPRRLMPCNLSQGRTLNTTLFPTHPQPPGLLIWCGTRHRIVTPS